MVINGNEADLPTNKLKYLLIAWGIHAHTHTHAHMRAHTYTHTHTYTPYTDVDQYIKYDRMKTAWFVNREKDMI